jgi:hypothetical protein
VGLGADLPADLGAVGVREPEVEHDEVRRIAPHLLQRRSAGAHCAHREPGTLEDGHHELADLLGVLDHEHGLFGHDVPPHAELSRCGGPGGLPSPERVIGTPIALLERPIGRPGGSSPPTG